MLERLLAEHDRGVRAVGAARGVEHRVERLEELHVEVGVHAAAGDR